MHSLLALAAAAAARTKRPDGWIGKDTLARTPQQNGPKCTLSIVPCLVLFFLFLNFILLQSGCKSCWFRNSEKHCWDKMFKWWASGNLKESWRSSKYCELACFEAGVGYEGSALSGEKPECCLRILEANQRRNLFSFMMQSPSSEEVIAHMDPGRVSVFAITISKESVLLQLKRFVKQRGWKFVHRNWRTMVAVTTTFMCGRRSNSLPSWNRNVVFACMLSCFCFLNVHVCSCMLGLHRAMIRTNYLRLYSIVFSITIVTVNPVTLVLHRTSAPMKFWCILVDWWVPTGLARPGRTSSQSTGRMITSQAQLLRVHAVVVESLVICAHATWR